MASELPSLGRKVIMACELSPGDSLTASCPSKRVHGETSSGIEVAMSPAKRQKDGVVDEKEVQDVTPRQGKSNLRGNEGEPLIVLDEGGNAGDATGSANLEAQGNLEIRGVVEPVVPQRYPSRRHLGRPTDTEFDPESITGRFRSLVCTLQDLRDRLEGRDKVDVLKAIQTTWVLVLLCLRKNHLCQLGRPTDTEFEPESIAGKFRSLVCTLQDVRDRLEEWDEVDVLRIVSKAIQTTWVLGLLCLRGNDLVAQMSRAHVSPNSEPGDIDVDNESLLAAYATVAGGNERGSSDGPCFDISGLGHSLASALDVSVPASVSQRQQNDPELREKIHKVETDYWAERISRNVYNEERFKLYTEAEIKEARIVWPEREEQSPAGYREKILEHGNYRFFDGGPSWDDDLYEFGCPFKESNLGGDEEAAKKRLRDKIEQEFEDPEAKRAEYERWEKIRDVETKYYENLISRTGYNKRRFALYTEAEREEKSIVWPNQDTGVCYSPAGFRNAVFEQYDLTEDGPDWQTRMDFHYPFSSETMTGEDNLCELCVPLIKEHREFLKVEIVRVQKVEAMKKAAMEKKMQEKAQKRREKLLAKKNGLPCAKCNKNFATEQSLSQHTAAKHRR